MRQASRRTWKLPLYQVDAFAERPFTGNPAAIVPLKAWLPAALMQRIAAENNLSETAFIVPAARRPGDDKTVRYGLRWFTPKVEVALCGHATLASGWVVFNHLARAADRIAFATKSGQLTVVRCGGSQRGMLELDFPARPAVPAAAPLKRRVERALGCGVVELQRSDRLMAVLGDAAAVAAAQPDFAALKALPDNGLIITAAAGRAQRPADFVSRYFAPYAGVDEDPVTGSAHCTLVPYWAARLGKTRLLARQISARGGSLLCELRADRVAMAGHVTPYLEGMIDVRV